MDDIKIKGSIVVDSSDGAKALDDINKRIKESKKAWSDAKIGSDEYKTAQAALMQAQKDLTTTQEKLKESTDGANGTTNKSAEAFGILKEKVQSLVPGLQGAEGAAGSFGSALKVLALNPIMLLLTAIVSVLAFVYEAFNNTSAGAKKTAQVMAGVSEVLGVVKDAAFILGRSLIDLVSALFSALNAAQKFMSFDFAGAKQSWSNAANSMKEVGKSAVEAKDMFINAVDGKAFALGEAVKKEEQLIKKAEREASESKAKAQRDLQASRDLLTDIDNKDLGAKKAAFAKVKAAEDEQAAVELSIAQRKLANKQKEISLETDGEKKHAAELTDLKNAVVQADTERLGIEIKMNRQYRMLTKQAQADAKEAEAAAKERAEAAKARAEAYAKQQADLAEARRKGHEKEVKELEAFGAALRAEEARTDALEKKRLADNLKTELENKKKVAELNSLDNPNSIKFKIAKIKADLALELSTLADGDLQKQILEKQANDSISQLKAQAAAADLKIAQDKAAGEIGTIKSVVTAANGFADAIGKKTVLGKAISAASALINTYEGIAAGVKLGYPMAIPAVIAAAATGFGAVKNILSTQVPGQSSGGGVNIPSVQSVIAPLAPQATSTTLDQATINSVGNAAAGGTSRAYVLDADINNNAERANRINRAARLH